ncbi:MAG: hypothetical protein GY898_23055 [Proteobacteria bacterium]|nr:hypothetical protein [Pseudomonadota bacterium]
MIITARDVYGELLPSPYTVTVERLGRPAAGGLLAKDVPPSGRVDAETAPHSFYRVRVVCEGHAQVSRNVGGSTDRVELVVPVEPSAVVGFSWPTHPGPFPGVVFEELDDRQRGTLLNIWAKLWQVSLGVTPVGAYVDRILEVRPDRLICGVSPELFSAFELGLELDVLELVSSAVGHEPPAGFTNGPSVKTLEEIGGLQVSIFESLDPGVPHLADIDVDEERGFPHAVRAAGHHLTGQKTDPVEVQQILEAQGISTGWRPLLV